MIAQAAKAKIALVENELDNPVYAGFDNVETLKKTVEDQSKNILFSEQIRKRASYQNNIFSEKNARALIEIGDLHFSRGSYSRASKAYIKALKLDDDNIPTFRKLIQSLSIDRKYDQAETFFKNFLKKVNNQSRYLNEYLVFRIMISLDNPSKIEDTRLFVESQKNSNDDDILNNIGLFYALLENDSSQARKYFNKSLKINNNNIDSNNNLGVSLRNDNSFNSAEKYLQKAHYLDLKYVPAYENLAGLYSMQNDFTKAILILENANDNKADISDIWKHNLAMFYYQNSNYEKSIEKYIALLDKEPFNSLIINNIGANYENIFNIIKANQFYTKSVHMIHKLAKAKQPIDERGVNAFINSARLSFKNNENEEALKIINDGHKFFPRNNILYHFESIIYLSQGDYSEAKDKLYMSLKLNPMHIESIVDLSYILEDIDLDYESAINLLEPLDLKDDTELHRVLINNLAFAYLKMDQIEKAEPLITTSDDLFASLATKGFYYIKKGDLVNAKKMYDKALHRAKGPDVEKVYQYYYFELMEYWINRNNIKKALFYAKKSIENNVNPSIFRIANEYVSEISIS